MRRRRGTHDRRVPGPIAARRAMGDRAKVAPDEPGGSNVLHGMDAPVTVTLGQAGQAARSAGHGVIRARRRCAHGPARAGILAWISLRPMIRAGFAAMSCDFPATFRPGAFGSAGRAARDPPDVPRHLSAEGVPGRRAGAIGHPVDAARPARW
jgi:hypothetical protein